MTVTFDVAVLSTLRLMVGRPGAPMTAVPVWQPVVKTTRAAATVTIRDLLRIIRDFPDISEEELNIRLAIAEKLLEDIER